MKKSYLILFLIISIFLVSSVDAQQGFLGYFKTNSPVNIIQTGDNGTGLFTYCNITSIRYPNSTSFLQNFSLYANAGEFSTTISPNYTYDTGSYIVSGVCGYPDEGWSYNFIVNPIGAELTNSQALVYILIFVIAGLFFSACLIGGITLPYDNKRDQMTGYIIALDNLKYLKFICWAIAYLLFMLMIYFAYILSFAYLSFDFLGNLFRFLFYGLLVLVVPLFVIGTYIIIANLIRDSKIQDALMGGQRVKDV